MGEGQSRERKGSKRGATMGRGAWKKKGTKRCKHGSKKGVESTEKKFTKR